MATSIFGLTFSSDSEVELARRISEQDILPGSGPVVIATANLDHIVILSRNPAFREAYRQASIITADGMPVYLYAKLRGLQVPARVAGSDLCWRILAGVSPQRHRLFFIVSTSETAARIRSEMIQRGFRSSDLSFRVPAYGFETDEAATEDLSNAIAQHGATHLFLGVGSPKSEVWTHQIRDRLGDCYVLNFGAGLDYFAGTQSRAPKLLREIGLEWAWRLGTQPRRLFKRYMVHSWRFLWVVGLDLSGRGA